MYLLALGLHWDKASRRILDVGHDKGALLEQFIGLVETARHIRFEVPELRSR